MTVGVLALQGDFERHLSALDRLNRNPSQPSKFETLEVRQVSDLDRVDRLIIPGGESTSVGILMRRFGMGDAIRERASQGMPVWGTCMGMIMMARSVEERPDQYVLNVLDIQVRRNAFGAQVHSFEDELTLSGMDHPVLGVFIRAPVVTALGPEVECLATYRDLVVAVRQGNLLGTSFHPELTPDTRLHEWFLSF